MGNKISKNMEESIKLREGIKGWPKKLKSQHLVILSNLIRQFVKRFRYGLAGHSYPYVEVPAYDDLMKEIIKILPFKKKSVKYAFQESRSQLNKNYIYYEQDMVKVTTISMDRKEASSFLSIFKNIDAKLDQMWIHMSLLESNFKEIDQETIEGIFYKGKFEEKRECRRKMVSDFLGEENKGEKYLLRRVAVLFGNDYRSLPLYMRLTYHKSALGEGNGLLRLHFCYKTYDDGEVVHMMPWEYKGEGEEQKNKKRKECDKEEEDNTEMEEEKRKYKELEEKEMEKYHQTVKEEKRFWISANVPSQELIDIVIEEMDRENREWEEEEKEREKN